MNVAIYFKQSPISNLLNQFEVFKYMYYISKQIILFCITNHIFHTFMYESMLVLPSSFYLFIFCETYQAQLKLQFCCQISLMLLVQKNCNRAHFHMLFCSLIVSWLFFFLPNLKAFCRKRCFFPIGVKKFLFA